MSIAYGLVFSLVLMSLVEYTVHRWPMHNARFVWRCPMFRDAFQRHAVLHHHRYYRHVFAGCGDPAAPHLNISIDPGSNILGMALVWVPMLWVWPAGAVSLAVVAGLHAVVWSAVHREMHEPRGRWFAGSSYFCYVRAYHVTHHRHPGTNFGAVLPPLWDMLFDTYRKPEDGDATGRTH